MGNIGKFCYKQGYEQQISSLIGRVLNELKRLGAPAATNIYSPKVFQPTDFLNKIWEKHGFINYGGIKQRFMYKSLNLKFEELESINTFYIQP